MSSSRLKQHFTIVLLTCLLVAANWGPLWLLAPTILLATAWSVLRFKQLIAPAKREKRQWQRDIQTLWLGLPLITVCLLMPPRLSDDYHRYLWEGYLISQGESPYQVSATEAPPELMHPSRDLVNHPDLTAIYPPLAQYSFRLAAAIGDHVWTWKLVITLWCIAGFWLYRRTIYLFALTTPLVLIEGFWNAHLDVLGILPGFVLLDALRHRLGFSAGYAIALMTGLKIVPIIFLAPVLLYLKGRDRLHCLFGFSLVMLLIYAPMFADWPYLFDSFQVFSQHWHFNNLIFHLLNGICHTETARWILRFVLFISYLAIVFWRADIKWKLAAIWMTVIVTSPTFYPWYLLWLVPFIPRSRGIWFLIAYACASLSYSVLHAYESAGIWRESLWWMVPEWIGLIICFAMLWTAPASDEATNIQPLVYDDHSLES